MTDKKDDNDRARENKLSTNPSSGTVRMKPSGQVADLDARRTTADYAVAQEKALLGALLWAGQNQPTTLRVTSVIDILENGEYFSGRGHAPAYDAIVACDRAGEVHEPITVHAHALRAGRSGTIDELQALADGASTISETKARTYAISIREAWARRQLMVDMRAIVDAAGDPTVTNETIATMGDEAHRNLMQRMAPSSTSVDVNQSASSFVTRMMGTKSNAVETGLRDLDGLLNGGFRPREVTVLAARTNLGKSLLSGQLAEHIVSASDDVGALYVTLEMVHEMFTARILSARSGVPMTNLRRGVLNATQWSDLTRAASEVSGKSLYFADSPSQTLAGVYAAAVDVTRRLKKIGKRLGLVVVDHVGLVKPSAELVKKANREQQVAETSRGLRYIASELECHVIGIAQIGRAAEQQKGSESMPKLHHLRETGSLEQDADNVLILHRKRDIASGMFDNQKPAALALAKGRMDETGIILLGYESHRMRFVDWNGGTTYAQEYGE